MWASLKSWQQMKNTPKFYDWVSKLDFESKTNPEVWKAVSHQPQGPHTGVGRLRNMAVQLLEQVKVDDDVKKVVRNAKSFLTSSEYDVKI